jgi:hypothetical protein
MSKKQITAEEVQDRTIEVMHEQAIQSAAKDSKMEKANLKLEHRLLKMEERILILERRLRGNQ